MKSHKYIFIAFLIFVAVLHSHAQSDSSIRIIQTTSFLPSLKEAKDDKIFWGNITLPENWKIHNGKTVKLAIAILRGKSTKRKCDPVVFIQGGPGGGSINGIRRWINHPIRNESDVILIDLRGTGFSQPSLCPDLGKNFMDILAQNDSPEKEIAARAKVALDCKSDLIKKGIDINCYNSKTISLDLHAIKIALNIKQWNLYGISYGTHISMIYENDFPNDINSIVLDSSIPPNAEYYNRNTSNYIRALNTLFYQCEKDPISNNEFKNLRSIYYESLKSLQEKPIELIVDKDDVPSGKFYFNAEDMMIAVQQCLYDRKLIQILPRLIIETHNRNENVLSNLIKAFGKRLSLDYGTYYCVLCNEILPYNSLKKFHEDVSKYKNLPGGLSFYEAEFSICKEWNKGLNIDSNEALINISEKPTLIFSGDFDPITPPANGLLTSKLFPNSYFIELPSFSHAASASDCGNQMVAAFFSNPKSKPNLDCFTKLGDIKFENNIILNNGISTLAAMFVKPKLMIIVPLIILLVLFTVISLIILWKFCKQKLDMPISRFQLALVICYIYFFCATISVINSIKTTALGNPNILAFGLPSRFNYVINLVHGMYLASLLLLVFYIVKFKDLSNLTTNVFLICTIMYSLFFSYLGIY